MLKNKIIVRKIRNIVILLMAMIVMVGAYRNIGRSRAEDVIEINAIALDNYGYLPSEIFMLEARDIGDDTYEIELPEDINSKKINQIVKITLEEPNVETESENGVKENATTENTVEGTTEQTGTTQPATEAPTTEQVAPITEEPTTQEPEQPTTQEPETPTPETEEPAQEENILTIIDNKIYLTKEQIDSKQLNIEVIYDVAILGKDEEGNFVKDVLLEKTEEERAEIEITEETQVVYSKILRYEDEENGKLVEVKGYLPEEAQLQIEEVSQEKLAEIFGESKIDVAYDIKIIIQTIKEVPVDENDPEKGTKQIIETTEINPEEFGEKCEVLIKDANIKEQSKVFHVKEDNTYEQVNVKENTQENISFEAQTFSIYAISSETDENTTTDTPVDTITGDTTDEGINLTATPGTYYLPATLEITASGIIQAYKVTNSTAQPTQDWVIEPGTDDTIYVTIKKPGTWYIHIEDSYGKYYEGPFTVIEKTYTGGSGSGNSSSTQSPTDTVSPVISLNGMTSGGGDNSAAGTGSTITASDYGGLVTNYNPAGVDTDVGWKIFYSDSDNIYLIADYFIDVADIPKGKGGTSPTASGNRIYDVNGTGVVNNYTGTADVTSSNPAAKWLSGYLQNKYQESTYNCDKWGAYLLDSSVWSVFKDSTYAEYAIGGPTLELFAASYNATSHSNSRTFQVNGGDNGRYGIKWSTMSSYTSDLNASSGYNMNPAESLYVAENGNTSSVNAYGMWFASTAVTELNPLILNCYGEFVSYSAVSSTYAGIRPVVCLKAGTQLEKQSNGTYLIVEADNENKYEYNTENINGNSTWKKTHEVTIKVEDTGSGLATGTVVQYAWQPSSTTTTPTSWSTVPFSSYSAGTKSIQTTISHTGITGKYRLWIKATTVKDVVGNTNSDIIKTGEFWFDNTAPTLNADWRKTSASGAAYAGDWTNQNVYANLTFSDANSGINKSTLMWKADSGSWATITANTSTSNYTDSWTDERNSTVYYKISDIAGNETTISYTVKIDKTGPTLNADWRITSASGAAYSGDWTNQNVYANLTFSDANSGINKSTLMWKENSGSWATITANTSTSKYTDTWTNERNVTAYYKISDIAGNETTISYTVKIDKTAPTATGISLSSTYTKTGKITATANGVTDNLSGVGYVNWYMLNSAGSYVMSASGSDAQWSKNIDVSSLAEGWYKVAIVLGDNAGNGNDTTVGASPSYIGWIDFCYDKTAPTITVSPTTAGWRNSALNVTISASDTGGSGLSSSNSYQYYVSTNATTPTGGEWKDYTATGTTITLNTQGVYYIFVKRVSDNAGNVSSSNSYHIYGTYNFDFTKPTITVSPASTGWRNSALSTTITIGESGGAGLSSSNSYQYYLSSSSTTLSGGEWKDYTSGTAFSLSPKDNASGTFYLFVKRVSDNAGNVSTASGTAQAVSGTTYQRFGEYKFDFVKPTAGTLTIKDQDGNTCSNGQWTSKNVSISMTTGSDEHSGHASTTYTVTKDGSTLYSSRTEGVTLTDEGRYTVTLTTRDNAGNVSTVTRTINIDRTPPLKPTHTSKHTVDGTTYTSGNWTNKQVTTTITAEDALSGVSYMQRKKTSWVNCTPITSSGTKYSVDVNWGVTDGLQETYVFQAIDAAGNVPETSESFTIKYDISGPDWKKQNVNVNIDTKKITLDLVVTDKYSGYQSNSLDTGDIKIYVNGVESTTLGKELSSATAVTGGVKYTLTLSNWTAQNVAIEIASGTATDKVGNLSETTKLTVVSTLKAETTISTVNDVFLGKSGLARQNIESVTFKDSISSATSNKWDVSANQDGSILAWYTDSDGNGAYEVYIGSDGIILANPNSSYLFTYIGEGSACRATSVINNIGLLNTSNVTDMSYMFKWCGTRMTSLDLGSNFDTSKVTKMVEMFRGLGWSSLTSLNLGSKFDTSKVTDMWAMFEQAGVNALASLNLGDKFDTSNVIDMQYMFKEVGANSSSLTNINLGDKFNTSKVIAMSYMFYDIGANGSLTSLDLGDKFDTSSVVKMIGMFDGAGEKSMTSLDLGPAFTHIPSGTQHTWDGILVSAHLGMFTNTGKENSCVIYAPEAIYKDTNTFRLGADSSTTIEYTRGTINPKYQPQWQKVSTDVDETNKAITVTVKGTTAGVPYPTSSITSTLIAREMNIYIDGQKAENIVRTVTKVGETTNETTGSKEITYTIKLSNFEEAVKQSGKSFKEWSGNISIQPFSGTLEDQYGNKNMQAIDYTAGTWTNVEIKDETESTANADGKMFADFIAPEFTYIYSVGDIDYQTKTVKIVFSVKDKFMADTTLDVNDLTIFVDGEEPGDKITKEFTSITDITEIVNGTEKVIGKEYSLLISGLEQDEIKEGDNYLDYSGVVTVVIPDGKLADLSGNTNTNTTITVGVDIKYDEATNAAPVTTPYVPAGYTFVEGSLDTGLVIEDSKGNQYVWVEVPKVETIYKTAGLGITAFTDADYEKIEDDLKTYTTDYRNGPTNMGATFNDVWSSKEATGLSEYEYNTQKKKMLKSIYKNGGFYIGRYETGIEDSHRYYGTDSVEYEIPETPVIKQNAYVYNYVTPRQAQMLSSTFATQGYTSSLMFGVQYDLVLKYLETKGTPKSEITTNSSAWGNYQNNAFTITNSNAKYSTDGNTYLQAPYTKNASTSALLTTGASDVFRKQNIYDLAGNVWEITIESSSLADYPCVTRAGAFAASGSVNMPTYRYSDYVNRSVYDLGFRVSLYKDEGTGANSTIEEPTYIPEGYTHVAGTSMENGYVVEDSKGNQYVWVEVPKTAEVYPTAGLGIASYTDAEYERIAADLESYTSAYSGSASFVDVWYPNYDIGLTESEYYTQKKKMLKSIYKNGGFYVGRYETGIADSDRTTNGEATQTPVIKQNAYPYTYVTSTQAQELSESFATEGYTSSLMFGVQGDLILKYLETKGSTPTELQSDNVNWGNTWNNTTSITNPNAKYLRPWYTSVWENAPFTKTDISKDYALYTTGASDTFSKQNIYDLLGNVWERTLEFYVEWQPLSRGDGFEHGSGANARTDSYVDGYRSIGFRVALYKDEGTGASSTSEEPTYIPDGYTHVPGTSMENGYVVEDSKGNQYVWVEVPKTAEVYPTAGLGIASYTDAEYERIETDLNSYSTAYKVGDQYTDEWSSEECTGLTEEEYNTQKKKMLKSIYKNGGFYVGRYETGIASSYRDYGADMGTEHPITEIPVIKANAYPYNWVRSNQAQTLASSFASEGYTSSLMFGVQWDLVLKYLETKGATQDELMSDSGAWGNYIDNGYTITNEDAKYATLDLDTFLFNDYASTIPYSKSSGEITILTTGADSSFGKMGIYDLAGNMAEWTLEYTSDASNPCAFRGGDCFFNGVSNPASDRFNGSAPFSNPGVGFRTALYRDEGTGSEGESTGAKPTYIPEGYEPVAGTTMENGYVVKDSNGNEFVWVEVPRTTTVYPTAGLNITQFTDADYTKIETDLHNYTTVYRNGTTFTDTWSSQDATGMSEYEYNTQKKKMLKSIYKNGGFYVGRYETGIDYSEEPRAAEGDTTQTPVIKQNAYPYNFVTTAQAQTLSETFATTGYTSSLMFGVQWDLILKYMETKGATQAELMIDSTAWGNYYNNTYTITNTSAKCNEYPAPTTEWISITSSYTKIPEERRILTTGASSTFSKQNIYDLAGNMWEWTLQNKFVVRGGEFGWEGYTLPAGRAAGGELSHLVSSYGFRTTLYRDEGTGAYSEATEPTYIPAGYEHVGGTTIEGGYVVEDSKGNQYVWVEVPRTTAVYPTAGLSITQFTDADYAKIEADLHNYTTAYRNGTAYTDTWSSKEATGMSEYEYNTQKKKMLKSIYKNGGFYVGRYETGIDYNDANGYRTAVGDTTQTPVIKQNAYPYNYVTVAQSQELATNFATEGYTSNLMFGVQWDLILKYLENKGTPQDEIIINSSEWGNYQNSLFSITNTSSKYIEAHNADITIWEQAPYNKNSEGRILLTTGATNRFSKQNISDFAGNVWENTLEYTGDPEIAITIRGGSVCDSVTGVACGSGSVAHRGGWPKELSQDNVGFRVALYRDEGTGANSTIEEPTYIPEGYEHVAGTTMESGYVIEDSKGNQYVWVEVPRTSTVYPTAGTGVTNFVASDYEKIEADLKSYTNEGQQQALIREFNAKKNTGSGHSNTTTIWKDLSGNNDGTLNGGTWGTDYLSLDGVDDWVNLGQVNLTNAVTLEATIVPKRIDDAEIILGNWEQGGAGIWLVNGLPTMDVYVPEAGGYHSVQATEPLMVGQTYHIAGTYDGSSMKIFVNGELKATTSVTGTIGAPQNNTVMAIGNNPYGDSFGGSISVDFANMDIYSAKVYNQALTTSQIRQSMTEDKWSSTSVTGMTESEYNEQKKKMLISIYKNEGFYVGRYETGIDYSQEPRTEAGATTQTPVIKQNAYPYNYVSTSQAQKLSESFESEGYTSSLMFGVQWDLVLKYLETKGATHAELYENSVHWGNSWSSTYEITNTAAKYVIEGGLTWYDAPYSKTNGGRVLLTTGATDTFSKQNIYDLAGNVWENTLEYFSNSDKPECLRGCSGTNSGSWDDTYDWGGPWNGSVNIRAGWMDPAVVGFRTALYKDETVGSENVIVDVVDPQWKVENINVANGKVTMDLIGTDKFYKESTLTNEQIKVLVEEIDIIAGGASVTKTLSNPTILTETRDGKQAEYGIKYTLTLTDFEEAVRQDGKMYREWSGPTKLIIPEGTLIDQSGNTNREKEISLGIIDTIRPEFTYVYSEGDIDYESKTVKIVFSVTDKYYEGPDLTVDDLTIFVDGETTSDKITKEFTKIEDITEKREGTEVLVGRKYTLVLSNLEQEIESDDKYADYSGVFTVAIAEGKVKDQNGNGNAATTITMGIDITNELPTNQETTPYMPDGYSYVTGSLNTGLVIADSHGNEYVWVEVPRTSAVYKTAGLNVVKFTDAEFDKIEADLHDYTMTYRTDSEGVETSFVDEWSSEETTGLTQEEYNTQKEKMLKSIYKNGGFYVGRYETGIDYSEGPRTSKEDALQTPVIKQNAYPYNYVTSGQAQKLSSGFASSGYTSSLMFGVQWDLMMKYLETSGAATQDELLTDSSSWGNFRHTLYNVTNTNAKYTTDDGVTWNTPPYEKKEDVRVCLTTGAVETFKKQNIYDLAGGAWEWTLEFSGDTSKSLAYRGSCAWESANKDSNLIMVNYRSSYIPERSVFGQGFRVTLYKDEGTGEIPVTEETAPYIPEGYAYVGGTLETGVIIQDSKGNEYVWVEVPKTAEVYETAGVSITSFTDSDYEKIENDLHKYTTVYRNGTTYKDEWSSKEATGLSEYEYNLQKKKMLKSIYKNGGFYVGRYETGIDYSEDPRRFEEETTQQTPVIKENAYPYHTVTNSQAQSLSTHFSTEGYTSSLMYGVQWDLIMKFLETKGTPKQELISDSTDWGNFDGTVYSITKEGSKYRYNTTIEWFSAPHVKTTEESILVTTGAIETFKKQNIYDLAGSLFEWTLEYSNDATYPCSLRGSGWRFDLEKTANLRLGCASSWSVHNVGFRVALYRDEGTGADSTAKQPTYIPEGYTHVAGTTMENGYVVKDSNGNEFVWVEVPKTSQVYGTAGLQITEFTDSDYTKIETDLHNYTTVYRNGTTNVDEYYSDALTGLTQNEYNTLKKKMLKSIYKNGGFYVGRYETGIDYSEGPRPGYARQTPVIKRNAYPYNYVTGAQSQELAESFATKGYTSSMMFGVQWDLVMKYLETKGSSQYELNKDSTSWGNYQDSAYNITNTGVKWWDGTTWNGGTGPKEFRRYFGVNDRSNR